MQQFSQSYPPCFHPNTHQSPDQIVGDSDDQNHEEQEDPLPLIDLQQISLEKLETACTDWGIFRLINHGIPSDLLSELHELAVRVFELGFESKQTLFSSILSSVMSYFWGTPAITPTGVALALSSDYNWVEGLNFDS